MTWKDIIKTKDFFAGTKFCKKCGELNEPYRIECKNCGESLAGIPENKERGD
jgi:uncharacterized OB-fold protein